MKLTASQIRAFDEIAADKEASRRTLGVALNFHANVSARLCKAEKEMWDELKEIHALDRSKTWTLEEVEGSLSIVEKE